MKASLLLLVLSNLVVGSLATPMSDGNQLATRNPADVPAVVLVKKDIPASAVMATFNDLAGDVSGARNDIRTTLSSYDGTDPTGTGTTVNVGLQTIITSISSTCDGLTGLTSPLDADDAQVIAQEVHRIILNSVRALVQIVRVLGHDAVSSGTRTDLGTAITTLVTTVSSLTPAMLALLMTYMDTPSIIENIDISMEGMRFDIH